MLITNFLKNNDYVESYYICQIDLRHPVVYV